METKHTKKQEPTITERPNKLYTNNFHKCTENIIIVTFTNDEINPK